MQEQYRLEEIDAQLYKPTIDYARLLNEAQLKAVVHREGPHLVIAGAGTGKTRTLVYRLAYLVEQGIDPRSILLLTFTRKAAQEMMHRASQLLDGRCEAVFGGTFHSFANMVLRKYARLLGYQSNFTILDRTDAEDILGILRTELGFSKLKTHFPRKEAIMNILSRTVNTGKSISQILKDEYAQFEGEEEGIVKVREEYSSYKLSRSIMDYDDLLVNLRRLLEEHQTVRAKLSDTYRYLMVDEYQDTNRLQAEIVYLLASEHQNVMVVGDDAQSIYSFRGADFRNILDFPKLFPGCAITALEQNYRSSQPILALTNAIISQAKERFTKELFSEISTGRKPLYIRTKSEYEEASFVCWEVRDLLSKGAQLKDIAVLFRSGWHSNELEVELSTHGIPFVKYGGIRFIEASHIKDILAFLRITFNPSDSIAWHRVLRMISGIGAATASKLIKITVDEAMGYEALIDKRVAKKKYGDRLRELYELILQVRSPGISLTNVIGLILNFYRPYFEQSYDDFRERANDLASLMRVAERYNSVEMLLSDLVLESPEKNHIIPASMSAHSNDNKLVLSTIHSAKGLEWETVFIIHLTEGCIPSSYAINRHESLEEERRLFYVATTRAKRNLYLVSPTIQGNNPFSSYGGPSRFLFEIKDLHKFTKKIS